MSRPDPGIDTEVNLGRLAVVIHDGEVRESVVGSFERHVEPVGTQCFLEDRYELVDSFCGCAEEVKVARLPIDDFCDHKRRSAGQGEALRCVKGGDYAGNALLQRT